MFLPDQAIYDLWTHQPDFIGNFEPTSAPLGKDAPIQPASLDLTIGSIYRPEVKADDLGGINNPSTQLDLKPGQTAVVQTKESLNLPSEVAAIAFPPSTVSSGGLLMTNPGHIDPAYIGYLSFTVINMGRMDYPLRRGERIVTILFFRLTAPSSDWKARYGAQQAGIVKAETLERLSSDFLSIEERATTVAKGQVNRAAWRTAWLPVIVGILSVIGIFVGSLYQSRITAEEKVHTLDTKLVHQQDRIDELDTALKALKATTTTSPR